MRRDETRCDVMWRFACLLPCFLICSRPRSLARRASLSAARGRPFLSPCLAGGADRKEHGWRRPAFHRIPSHSIIEEEEEATEATHGEKLSRRR